MTLRLVPRYLIAVSILMLACVLFGAQAYADMRIFDLQHRPAEVLADTVRNLVGDEAKIAVHRNTLVVRSTPAVINEVARLVAEYDKPMRMLRITVEQGMGREDRRQRASASGRLETGSATIGVPSRPRVGDASIFISTGDVNARLQGNDVSHYENRKASQFVSVLDGSPAIIRVGRSVPFTSQLRYYSRRHPRFVESIEYQRVDTGFEVLPEVFGGNVRLKINPFMAFLDQDSPNQIVFQEMASTVSIPLGAWYDLSDHMSTQNDLSREILGVGKQSVQDSNRVRIRVDKNP